MRLFFGKRTTKPVDLVNNALRGQVSVGVFKIDHTQAEHIKKLEKTAGHDAALAQLLKYLYVPRSK